MTDYDKLEERRQIARSNYYAQMAMMGYGSDGNALDLVKVVRCRDCKYGRLCFDANGQGLIQCTNPYYPAAFADTWLFDLDWYCAGGERRDDDGSAD